MTDSTLPTSIFLVDRTPALANAWQRAFERYDYVTIIEGDYFSQPADAMVSPANSFGIMDGGLDLAIRDTLGSQVQRRAQQTILDNHHGELPVGQAEIVSTDHAQWPHLIVAPTMRIPESISRTTNAYLAFRAILLSVMRFNRRRGSLAIGSVVCSGLGTGVGAMSPERCAVQMSLALRHVSLPARIPSFKQIHEVHDVLRRS